MNEDAGLVARLRDASWFNRPNVRRIKMYHVCTMDSPSNVSEVATALCTTAPMSKFTARPLGEIPRWLRCQRPACRQRWPEGCGSTQPDMMSGQKEAAGPES